MKKKYKTPEAEITQFAQKMRLDSLPTSNEDGTGTGDYNHPETSDDNN